MVSKMAEKTERKRVVITGMGVVCPVGNDVEGLWKSILAGRSGVAGTTIFDASSFPTKFSAEVKDYDYTSRTKRPELHAGCSRGTGFTIGAAAEACGQAGIDIETDAYKDGIDRHRMGIYLGAGEGSADNDVFFDALSQSWDDSAGEMDWRKWAEISFGKLDLSRELEQEANMPAGHLAMMTGARGPSRSCLTACAASTQAVGEAAMLIRRGAADVILSGGSHSMIHPLGLTGFNRLTALSRRNESPETASRPFSASRDGFILGEGAAIVILESLESAKRRGAEPLAEVIGYGSSSDAFRVTDMHEEGRGAVQAINSAIKDAGIDKKDIDYISTHGTSTIENDSIETKAIKAVFGQYAGKIPASSVKSMFGHLIGATGATELITCVLAIRDGIVPATMNLHDADPELDLDYVANEARRMNVEIAINESFGFGGQNNVVILRRL